MLCEAHELDICECGDYRRDHVGGTGECRMPNDLSHGFRRCKEFRMFRPHVETNQRRRN